MTTRKTTAKKAPGAATMETAQRRIEYIPLDQIVPAERNPKKHRTGLLTRSIDRFGFANPALRDERTGRLVVGHGRTQALAQMYADGQSPPEGVQVDGEGRWLIPVVCGWSSRSDAEAAAYLVTDNRHSEIGGWDHPELAQLLMSIDETDPDLAALTGWEPDELADLLKATEPPDLDKLADEVGEPGEGDMWPTIKIRVPQHVAAAWNSHLSAHDKNDVRAFAALLEVDPYVDTE